MDMYTDNNGFQVIEGTTPFDEDGQFQEEDSLPVAPYQETTTEYGAETCMEKTGTLPVESEQTKIAQMGEYVQTAEPETEDAETVPAVSEEDDEETRRARHEAAEAERKAEWEARQQQKKDALKKQQEELDGMSDEEIVEKSMKRINADTEKLTRRNMKECVAEYIQTLCLEDISFARMTMDPKKSMLHCFEYISHKAWDYVQDEMKVNGIKPGTGQQGYGCDIPDDLCYQWAEDYFRNPLAKEDEEEEERFVPKPYVGKSGSKPTAKKKTEKQEKKATEKETPKKSPETEKKAGDIEMTGQLSLLDMMAQQNKAS